MQVHEEIYTSATALLEGGESNLGVVAKSRGFPPGVENELAAHRAYTRLPDLAVENPAAHPPRYVVASYGKERSYLGLTRITYCGADHTGRTAPLAHHLLINWGDISAARATVASVAGASGRLFVGGWHKQPQWINPPREIAIGDDQNGRSPIFGDNGSQAGTLAFAIADAVLRYRVTARPVVVCLPRAAGQFAVDIAADIVSLLPPSWQREFCCASHVISTSDAPRNAALLLTYAETPFLRELLERQDSRRPHVVRLDKAQAALDQPQGGYGAALEAVFRAGGWTRAVAAAGDFEAWGHGLETVADFAQEVDLQLVLESVVDKATLAAAREGVAKCADLQLIPNERMSKWQVDAVERIRAGLEPAAARTECAVAIRYDKAWSDQARQAARGAMLAQPAESIKAVLGVCLEGNYVSSDALADIGELLGANDADDALSETLIKTLGCSDRFGISMEMYCELCRNRDTAGRLGFALRAAIRRSLDSLADLRALKREAVLFKDRGLFEICREKLSATLTKRRESLKWPDVAGMFVTLALAFESREDIEWLFNTFRDRINEGTEQSWRLQATGPQRRILEDAIDATRERVPARASVPPPPFLLAGPRATAASHSWWYRLGRTGPRAANCIIGMLTMLLVAGAVTFVVVMPIYDAKEPTPPSLESMIYPGIPLGVVLSLTAATLLVETLISTVFSRTRRLLWVGMARWTMGVIVVANCGVAVAILILLIVQRVT